MQALLKELRANQRLRLGLWLVLAILLGYGLLLLEDARNSLQQQHREALERLARLQALAGQTVWQDHAAAAAALKVQVWEHFWRADSKGYAQAAAQAWLDIQAKQAGIKDARVKVEAAQDLDSGPVLLWRISASLEANFVPAQFEQLLLNLALQPQWSVVERLDVIQGYKPHFSLVLSLYFQASEAP